MAGSIKVELPDPSSPDGVMEIDHPLLIDLIFLNFQKFLDSEDLKQCRVVCSTWNDLIPTNHLTGPDFANVHFTKKFAKRKIPRGLTSTRKVTQNVVLVGDYAVGKTSMIYACLKKEPAKEQLPCVNVEPEFNSTRVMVANSAVTSYIWELETFCFRYEDRMQNFFRLFKWAHIILLCFSVEKRDTFENISAWSTAIDEQCPKLDNNPIKILLGLKADLRQSELHKEVMALNDEEFVTTEEGKKLAKKIGALAYLECSASELEGTQQIFQLVSRAAIKYKRRNKRCSIL